MTFPVVAAANYSEETVNTTTHDVLVPSGISAGNLLMLFSGIDGNAHSEPSISGWTNLKWDPAASSLTYAVWYKIADGSETNFTYTTSVAEQSVNRTWRITGAHASSPPETHTFPFDSGSSSTIDFGALTPSWGSDDNLWICFGVLDGGRSVTAYPTDFTDNQYTDQTLTGGNGAGLGICSRNLTAATLNPDTMTLDALGPVIGYTWVVRPATASVSESQDAFGASGFFGT